jgi:hypothetical protein
MLAALFLGAAVFDLRRKQRPIRRELLPRKHELESLRKQLVIPEAIGVVTPYAPETGAVHSHQTVLRVNAGADSQLRHRVLAGGEIAGAAVTFHSKASGIKFSILQRARSESRQAC